MQIHVEMHSTGKVLNVLIHCSDLDKYIYIK